MTTSDVGQVRCPYWVDVPFKKIARDVNEDARNHARSLKGTPEFETPAAAA
jgi:hypothetical protein